MRIQGGESGRASVCVSEVRTAGNAHVEALREASRHAREAQRRIRALIEHGEPAPTPSRASPEWMRLCTGRARPAKPLTLFRPARDRGPGAAPTSRELWRETQERIPQYWL